MTAITKIIARVVTADLEYADTQSRIHLGIAGREFRLATGDERDFARGSELEFVLGEDANVLNPEHNDPRLSPVLDTADLDFTVQRVTTGNYTIRLRRPFATTPTVTATVAGRAWRLLDNAHIRAIPREIDICTGDDRGNRGDRDFHFRIIEQPRRGRCERTLRGGRKDGGSAGQGQGPPPALPSAFPGAAEAAAPHQRPIRPGVSRVARAGASSMSAASSR